jgi:DNA-binding transcriptional regulator YhcF (GntR family)
MFSGKETEKIEVLIDYYKEFGFSENEIAEFINELIEQKEIFKKRRIYGLWKRG